MTVIRPLQELYDENIPLQNPGKKIKQIHEPTSQSRKVPLSQRILLSKLTNATHSSLQTQRWNPSNYFNESHRFSPKTLILPQISSQNTPFCIASYNHSRTAAVGIQDGSIVMVRVGDSSTESSVFGYSPQHHGNAIFDISTSSDDQFLASSSSTSIKIYDSIENKIIREEFSEYRGSVKQIRFHPDNNNILAFSTRTGEIEIRDLRLKGPSPGWWHDDGPLRCISNCHDLILRENKKIKLKRTEVSVTSLCWGSSDTILSAGEACNTIKFWDVRNMPATPGSCRGNSRKIQPIMTTPMTKCLKGVTSLALDRDDGKIWAMQMDNTVVSYWLHAPNLGIVDVLTHPDLKVNSFYTKMSLVNQNSSNFGSYIACGGSMQLVLFEKPARNSPKKQSTNATILRTDHGSPITCSVSNPKSDSFITVADDSSMNVWRACYEP